MSVTGKTTCKLIANSDKKKRIFTSLLKTKFNILGFGISRSLSLRCLVLLLLGYSISVSAQNHSFGYIGPICKNGANPSPTVSANFISGGTFLGTAGLSVNAANGSINLALTNPGTYTVTYTGAICACFTNAPVSATVEVLSNPTIAIAGNGTVCSNSAITLTATGASSFVWSSGPTTSVMTDFPFANVTTYTVTGTATNGCSGSAVRSVTLVPTPTLNLSGNATVCVGYNYTMAAISNPSAGASYTWSGSAPITGSGAIVNTSLTTTSTFSVLVSVAGCTADANIGVSAIPIPTISIIGTNTICNGGRVTLYALGGATYTWNTGPVADSLGIQPTVSTSYSVIGSDINGCSSSAFFNVNVLPVPSVSIVGGPSVCSGKSVALTAAGAVSYTWFSGAQTAAINFAPASDSTIFVTGTNAQGCKGTAILSVQVLPTPTVSVANASVCSGQSVALLAEPQGSVQNGITYLWLPGAASGANYNPTPVASSIYTLSSSLGSCVSRTTVTVTVVPSTSVFTAFKYDSPVCSGGPPIFPVLSGSFTTGGTFYSSAELTVDGFTGMVDLLNVPEGIYSIQYSIAAQDCRVAGLNGSFIQVKNQTKLSFPADSYTIGPGESVTLTVQGNSSGYSWNPSSGLSCSSCKAPSASPLETTEYCVSSTDDCVSGACVKVNVICSREGDFSVPTAFTPNGDGTNDQYCLKGWDECNKGFNIKIFDRWGEMVYESNKANFCWDGRYKGDLLPTGVYVYFITANYDEVPEYRQSGNISLIR